MLGPVVRVGHDPPQRPRRPVGPLLQQGPHPGAVVRRATGPVRTGSVECLEAPRQVPRGPRRVHRAEPGGLRLLRLLGREQGDRQQQGLPGIVDRPVPQLHTPTGEFGPPAVHRPPAPVIGHSREVTYA